MSELICQACNITNCECVPYDVECDSCRRAYQQGRTGAIDEFVSMLTTKEIAQTYDFDDVLCNGNYDANFNDFRNYVREIAEQLKEIKI